jgi:NAD(P)-dependent dehydrogenase (short-subunit alcohol dehydrogenase family)
LIHGRSEKKLADVQATLSAQLPNATIDTYRADLSKFDDVKAMVLAIANDHDSIDIIINNAGIFKPPDPITEDGLDIRFVVNTFAPYIIAKSLLPLLASDGRIINLSSAAQEPISLQAMKGEQRIDEAFQAYAQSKLAITIWSQELAKSLKQGQVIMAVNPGSLLASKMVKEGFGVAGNDLSIGANILKRTALSSEFEQASGMYFDNDSGKLALPHSDALDPKVCEGVMAALNEVVEKYYGKLG